MSREEIKVSGRYKWASLHYHHLQNNTWSSQNYCLHALKMKLISPKNTNCHQGNSCALRNFLVCRSFVCVCFALLLSGQFGETFRGHCAKASFINTAPWRVIVSSERRPRNISYPVLCMAGLLNVSYHPTVAHFSSASMLTYIGSTSRHCAQSSPLMRTHCPRTCASSQPWKHAQIFLVLPFFSSSSSELTETRGPAY